MLGFWQALRISAFSIAAFSALPSLNARADDVADFYKGKQITFIIGSDPGGGYDLLGRLVARHLGQFIPGNPGIVIEDMPASASMVMSNLIYNTSPEDGTVIGLVKRGILISELTRQPGVHFEVAKFNWIGSVSSEVSLIVSWHTAAAKTFQDLMAHQLIVGGTGASGDTEASARLLNAVAGTKFKIVSGYPGTADVLLAMERGELDGVADLSWSEMKVKNADLLAAHELNLLAQNTLVKAPDLPNVPLAMDFVTNPADRPVGELFYAMKGVARPILVGPKVPADRVAALRSAFSKMVQDPSFKQDAVQQKLELAPSDYKSVEDFVTMASAASPAVKERLTAVLNTPH
jgi:tripartite-type tricarboxylate transporter receptor subunit TctC